MTEIKERIFKEIGDSSYSLTYRDTGDAFICSECAQDKEGLHMVHSIFFEAYTDEAPMCLDCVQTHVDNYAE